METYTLPHAKRTASRNLLAMRAAPSSALWQPRGGGIMSEIEAGFKREGTYEYL